MELPESTIAEVAATTTASEDSRNETTFTDDHHEIDRYLDAVIELQKSMSSVTVPNSSAATSSVPQISTTILTENFRDILLSHSYSLIESIEYESPSQEFDSNEETTDFNFNFTIQFENHEINISSTSSIRRVDLIPCDAVYELRSIADRLFAAGHLRECIQVYASVRKFFVEECLKKLTVKKMSVGEILRLDWETLETRIERWIRAMKVCVRVLFASERKLCEEIFEGMGNSADDDCFIVTIKGPAIQLLNFAEAISISISRRSPEKLFKISELHYALADLLPDIETVFYSRSSESIRILAVEITSRLADASRGMLSEFESAVLRKPSEDPVPDGTIHPFNRYVVNYIGLISDYQQTLIELIVSKPNGPDIDLSEFEGKYPTLALHLIWIIEILNHNLEEKCKHYKDVSLGHLFMMNNVYHIAQKINESPELKEMIGDDYLRKLTWKFRLAATSYLRSAWGKVLYCLRDPPHFLGALDGVIYISKIGSRDRVKAFNVALKEVVRTQAPLLIPDTQLREEFRISLLQKLIPAYRSFLGRFDFERHIERSKHIKYTPEDLENAVLESFEGHPASQRLWR